MRPSRKFIVMLGAVAAASLAGWMVWSHGHSANAAPEMGKTETGQQAAAPVFAAAAKSEDVPIILRGIGSVQAYNTVSVKSQVTGAIVQVAYKEGQDVKAGDLLLQLDPRPTRRRLTRRTPIRKRTRPPSLTPNST